MPEPTEPATGDTGAVPRPSSPEVSLWALRVVWVGVALLVGGALDAALGARAGGTVATVSTLGWAVWVVVLVATLVPCTISLTVVRSGVPLALGAAVWAASEVGEALELLAVVVAAGAVALVLSPIVGDRFVDGSSYGTERRFVLRAPLPLSGLAVVTWTVLAASIVGGPLLLGAGALLAGAAATALGAVAAVVAARALHQLSRRWLVLVPSGVVVHDPTARPDSVMAPRGSIVGFGPAPTDSEALDLTLGASGLALELRTDAPLPITVRTGRHEPLSTTEVTALLVTPSRPAAVLAEARRRRLPAL